jgi:restriction system protein
MKEDRFVLSRGRLTRVGSRNVPPYERDPDKFWIGSSQWYLDLPSFSLIHHGEQIGTDYAVDPSVLIHTQLAVFGDKTPDGKLVKSPTVTWFEISNNLFADPDFRFEFCSHPEKLEHFLAAAHCLEGYDSVTVTPRSGDKGRDVIAEQNTERLLHEAKAYNATRLVKAEQVRALYGVWNLDEDATKAVITTTSDFAPGVAEEFFRVMPDILQTVSGTQLVDNIQNISATQSAALLSAILFAAAGVEIKPDQNGRLIPQRSLITWQQLRESFG